MGGGIALRAETLDASMWSPDDGTTIVRTEIELRALGGGKEPSPATKRRSDMKCPILRMSARS